MQTFIQYIQTLANTYGWRSWFEEDRQCYSLLLPRHQTQVQVQSFRNGRVQLLSPTVVAPKLPLATQRQQMLDAICNLNRNALARQDAAWLVQATQPNLVCQLCWSLGEQKQDAKAWQAGFDCFEYLFARGSEVLGQMPNVDSSLNQYNKETF